MWNEEFKMGVGGGMLMRCLTLLSRWGFEMRMLFEECVQQEEGEGGEEEEGCEGIENRHGDG